MPFVHTCVRVRDLAASSRFHEALGFEQRGRLNFDSASTHPADRPRF